MLLANRRTSRVDDTWQHVNFLMFCSFFIAKDTLLPFAN